MIAGSIPLQNRTGLAVGGLSRQCDDLCRAYLALSELKPMVIGAIGASFDDRGRLFSRVLRFWDEGKPAGYDLADIISK